MSVRHEQLKKNVEITRQRLDNARAKRLESVKLHKRHKWLNVAMWFFAPLSAGLLAATWPLWVFWVWSVVFGLAVFWCWQDVIQARKDITGWRERELENLSEVADDIHALVERETLQLMDPEAYALIERANDEKEELKALELSVEKRNKEVVTRRFYGPELGMPGYWTETMYDGTVMYKTMRGGQETIVRKVRRW